MKRGKKLLALLGVLAVLSGATLIARNLNPEKVIEEETEEEAVSVFSLNQESLTGLSWEYNGENLAFTYAEGVWTYADDSSFPLDDTYVAGIAEALGDVKATKTIEAAGDLAEYGLDAPACRIVVSAEGDTEILIGDESAMGGERYLSVGDGKVYLVDSDLLDAFDCVLYDMVVEETIPSMTEVTGFTVEAENQTVEISRIENSGLAYSDLYVWFLKSDEGWLTLDNEQTEDLIETVTRLSWAECVNYKAGEEALAEYGLDHPAIRAKVDYVETVRTETNQTDSDGNPVYDEEKEDRSFVLEIGAYEGDYCYAKLENSAMVYLIDASVYDALMYTGYPSLMPDEVLLMDWDDVTAVDIILNGDTWHIVRELRTGDGEDTAETYVYTLDGIEVDILDILDDLTGLDTVGNSAADTPERNAEIGFVLYRDSDIYPETKLFFYPYDSSSCLASLNGEARLLVSRSDVLSVTEAVNQLILGS